MYAVAVDLEVVHPDYGDYVVDDPATEAYFGDEVLTVGVYPVL